MADPWQSQGPPQGPLPDHSSHVIAAAICAIVFSTAAVVLRCVARRMSKAGFWWDDWIIIASLPAVATVSICLPSVWSLCILGYKRFPTEYIRSRWSNRSINFRSRSSKRDSHKVSERSATPLFPEKARTYPVSRQNTAEDKKPFANVKENPRSFSPATVFEEEPSEDIRSPGDLQATEFEQRVRLYYNHSAFSGGSQEALQQGSWNRDDLEKGGLPMKRNPLPVPPKEKYTVVIS
ncbi:MAG: hypothetical protein Q9191_004329 [Dirinaria sp. TL-2023a]